MLLTDGFSTTVTFAAFPGFLFREKEVQASDFDGGGGIDTTTMRNTRLRTKQPKSLMDVGPITMQVQYDPDFFTLFGGVSQIITTALIVFPDLSSVTITGWLDKIKPASNKEGDFPLAEVVFIPSNQSIGPAFTEVAPVYAAPVVARPPATA